MKGQVSLDLLIILAIVLIVAAIVGIYLKEQANKAINEKSTKEKLKKIIDMKNISQNNNILKSNGLITNNKYLYLFKLSEDEFYDKSI